MLSTMSTSRMVIPRQLQTNNRLSQLDQCGGYGLLGIFDCIFCSSTNRENTSALSQRLFSHWNNVDAGMLMQGFVFVVETNPS